MKIYEIVEAADPALKTELRNKHDEYARHKNPGMRALAPFILKLIDDPNTKYDTVDEYIAAAQKIAVQAGAVKPAPTKPAPTKPSATPVAEPADPDVAPSKAGRVKGAVKKSVSRHKSAYARGKELGQRIVGLTQRIRPPSKQRYF